MSKLTAETITDEEIREGCRAGLMHYSLLEFATFPAWAEPLNRAYYRGRCAEILNEHEKACR